MDSFFYNYKKSSLFKASVYGLRVKLPNFESPNLKNGMAKISKILTIHRKHRQQYMVKISRDSIDNRF